MTPEHPQYNEPQPLPRAADAIIDERKVREYLLSVSHPVGRFKAAYFATLGYSDANWRDFVSGLRTQHLTQTATPVATDQFGTKYEITAPLLGPSARIGDVVSVWIILLDEQVPRFITAYPAKRA